MKNYNISGEILNHVFPCSLQSIIEDLQHQIIDTEEFGIENLDEEELKDHNFRVEQIKNILQLFVDFSPWNEEMKELASQYGIENIENIGV